MKMLQRLLLLACCLLAAPAQAAPKRVLIVLTSHSELFGTGRKTGFWFEEMATPYYAFKQAGAEVTLTSLRGGHPPVDPKSDDDAIPSVKRFKQDAAAMEQLRHTQPLARLKTELFDAVFLAGGHGALWDFADNGTLNALLQGMLEAKKPVAAVCHAPQALLALKNAQGLPLMQGRRVTAFTRAEEKAAGLDQAVPRYLDAEFKEQKATFSAAAPFQPHVVQDGLVITGQNPASSAAAAAALLKAMR